ncbi:hypothetical protein VTJ49DRAFT_7334 [Mycothermus thermophilus]|uniref:Glyoxylate reductase n=1 Tax=Humicola insolens TaxID=85995 RepID=A0ABR3VIG1_HUMIN
MNCGFRMRPPAMSQGVWPIDEAISSIGMPHGPWEATYWAEPKVLLLEDIKHAHSSWATIESLADVISPTSSCRQDFLAEAASGAFDGCVAVYRTWESIVITGKFDAEVLDTLPSSIRFISHKGAGYDQVDVAACTARGIQVSNTPGTVDDGTANLGIFLLLGALRNLPVCMAALRDGKWRGTSEPALGHDPEGKVLGILGMGGIGRNMARKARAFGMKIRYHNRARLDRDTEKELEAEYVGFDELLAGCDALSLNLPLTESTRHIISKRELSKMKKGVVIVNTARGAIMDEAALVEALDSGQVSSVGLDVFESEPQIHPRLLNNPRVLLTPHLGTWTVETQEKMEELAIKNLHMFLTKGKPCTVVPEQRDM